MSFVHPAFLWGLLAVSIPVIIHLFQFRRYRTLHFSDTRLIEELQSENKRQSQLKKLIILSLRILAIIAIVLAFAQPYRQHRNQIMQEGTASVLIYVDNSYSMENTAEQGNLLNEAKNRAEAIADAFGESGTFMLLTNDMEGRHTRFFNKEGFREELARVQTSPNSRPMHELIEYGTGFLEQEKNRNRQIFIISDFQKTTARLQLLPSDSSIRMHLVPLKANKTANLYIDSCWFESPLFLDGQECRLEAIVRNGGPNDMEQLPVKLYVNGKQKAMATTDVPAGGRALMEIAFTPDPVQWQQACLEISDYPVTFDDKLYLSFRIQGRHPVLCLQESAENMFLKALYADDPAFDYRHMSLQQMDYSQLPKQNLVILNSTEPVGSGCLQELKSYVENGGCLLVIPSTKKDIALRNDISNALGIPAFTKIDTQRSRVSEVQMEHQLFKHTMEKPSDRVQWPAVYRHYQYGNGLTPGKETLIALENGDELLGVQPVGKGRIYMLTVPLDDAFSEFQRHALFVPTLYNMALFKNNPPAPFYWMGGNNPIPLEAESLQDERLPELQNEALHFRCIPEIRNNYNSSDLFLHDQIREAGNYVLCSNGDTLQIISFNYDRKESEPDGWTEDELKQYCKGQNDKDLLPIQHLSSAAVAEKIKGRSGSGSLFIWLALAFLLAESILLRLWKE